MSDSTLSWKQVVERYGKIPLMFSSYYKYEFTFKGTDTDGIEIIVIYGGDYDSIYRYSVSASGPVYIDSSEWKDVTVRNNNTYLYSGPPEEEDKDE